VPEGPEVETIRRTLEPQLLGRSLHEPWTSGLKLRSNQNEGALKALEHKPIKALGRRGKLMWIDFAGDMSLLVRLGMTGRLYVKNRAEPTESHTHFRAHLDRGELELRFVDPRRFGDLQVVDAARKQHEINRIGPDPLSWKEEEKLALVARVRASDRTIKDILLDQSVLAGVGNIYASESLFAARIHPQARGCQLSKPRIGKLLEHTAAVLELAVRHNGTTFSNYVDGAGKKGDNLNFVNVFQRTGEPCYVCQKPIRRAVQSGRSTFYCMKCQKCT